MQKTSHEKTLATVEEGVELDLTALGYEDEFLSAYQNYLGGGMLGGIGNSCTVEDWMMDEKLVRLAEKLSEYYQERMEELVRIEGQIEQLKYQKTTLKVKKPVEIEDLIRYTKFFFEHLDILIL